MRRLVRAAESPSYQVKRESRRDKAIDAVHDAAVARNDPARSP